MLLGVLASMLSSAPSARAAATLTVCPSGCSDTNIQAAVNAASPGDTVDVRSSGSPYTQQVIVAKPITLEGDPNDSRPLLRFTPSSTSMPTLRFTIAASPSTLKHMVVQSNGGQSNDAVVFEHADGTITDLKATAANHAVVITAKRATVGPNVSATSTGTAGEALVANGPIRVTGVTATATGKVGYAGVVGPGATVSDSTFSGAGGGPGGGIGLALQGSSSTARRVVATGGRGIVADGASVTDSLAVGIGAAAVEGGSTNTIQLRNVTAISSGSGAPGIEAGGGSGPSSPGGIVAENVIARGGSGGTDVLTDPGSFPGVVRIGYSNFRTTSSTGVDSTSIGHNQSGDPLFVDGVVGPSQNFHLQDSSPVIGAGTILEQTSTSDLDGKPRPAAGQSEPSMGAYEPTVHSLTVTVSGGGSVSGQGISCPNTCSSGYVAESTVTLTPTAGSGSVFSGWSGACSGSGACQVTMSSDRAVTATFTGVAPPANTAPPVIGGTPVVGQTLVASDGSWRGSPTSFAYQWQDCDITRNQCTSVIGASANTYKLTAGDVGHTMRIVVTAMNAIASSSASSAQTATVTAAPALSHVRLIASAFTANKGTTLTLTLSEAATINVLVTQARHGRKVKGRCRQGAKHGQRCTLTVQKAKLAFRGASGPDRFKLQLRSLAPGRYTATITARAKDGETSKPAQLSFTVK